MISQKIYPILSGVFAVFLWAFAPALIKISQKGHDFSYFILARYVISTSITCFIARKFFRKIFWSGIKNITNISEIDLFQNIEFKKRINVLICAILVVIHNTCQVYCLKQISVCWYTLFFSLTPVLTIFFFTRFSWRTFLYFIIAFFGAFLILQPKQEGFPETIYVIALLFSILAWVILTVFLKELHKNFTDLETAFLLNFANLLSALILWLYSGLPYEVFSNIELMSLVLLGISSPIALYLFSYAMRNAPIFTISAQYIEIIFGFCIGVILFQENLNTNELVGAVFIIFSILLTSKVDIISFINKKSER